jgi:hypothetical protein
VSIASLEDILIAKLEWSQLRDSALQRQDVPQLLKRAWGRLDRDYSVVPSFLGAGSPCGPPSWIPRWKGGWAALMSAAQEENIGCAVSVAGANMAVWARQIVRDAEGRKFWEDMLEEYESGSPARGRGRKSVMELLEHSSDYDLITHAHALAQKPLLIIAGWKDQQITLEETVLPLVRALQAAGARQLTPVTLNDDHMFSVTRSKLHNPISSLPSLPHPIRWLPPSRHRIFFLFKHTSRTVQE